MWFCVPLASLERVLVKQRIAWDFRRLEDVAPISKSGVDCWRRKDSAEQLGGEIGREERGGKAEVASDGSAPLSSLWPISWPTKPPQHPTPNTYRVS